MNKISDLEQVLSYLKSEKGIAILHVSNKIGVERDIVNNVRRYGKAPRKKELLDKIVAEYHEELKDYIEQPEVVIDESFETIKNKYITMLEEQNQALKAEKETMKDIILKRLDELEKKLLKRE